MADRVTIKSGERDKREMKEVNATDYNRDDEGSAWTEVGESMR